MKATAFSRLLPEAPPSRKSLGGACHPGAFLGTRQGLRCQRCPGRPGPRQGAEWSSRAEVSGDSRAGARTGGRAPNSARDSRLALRDHRAQQGRGQSPRLALQDGGVLGWLGTGNTGPGRPLATGAQSPRAAWTGPRWPGRGAGATAGPGPRSLARPPVRASVRAAGRAGAGARGPAQEVPPASASCPPPLPPAAPPRPGPRSRRRRCSRRSRPPPARWA